MTPGLSSTAAAPPVTAETPTTPPPQPPVQRIVTEVPFGAYVRSVHHWSANLLIVVAVLHLIRVFATGSYRPPRELNWLIGVAMLLLTLGGNFTGYLLPLKIGIFFQTGDLTSAVTQGAALVGWPISGFGFAETERFMGLYHEVAPASQALSCSSCHGGNRLNFAALGYTPKAVRNGKPLCASCHSAKSGNFNFVHTKHVTDKRIDCIECHSFSKAS